eukprot:SAG31_NODE_4281_length_3382_cov_3.978373_4_plen_434_part_00
MTTMMATPSALLVLTGAASLLEASSAQKPVSWPRGPALSCQWNMQTSQLDVSWEVAMAGPPAAVPADVYEIQIAEAPSSRAAAIFSTGKTNASFGLDLLLPDTRYHLSARAHAGWAFGLGHAMGAGTWGMVGPSTPCKTGAGSGTFHRSTQPARQQAVDETKRSFSFESWRMSEWTNEVDYLLNHDSADALGSSLLLTAIAQYEALAGAAPMKALPYGPTAEAVLTVYCIETLPPTLPGNVTTGGSKDFVDYLSCNNQADHTSPSCSCAVAPDRQWGRLSLSPDCSLAGIEKIPCASSGPETECVCKCNVEEIGYSSVFTGMMPVFAKDDKVDQPIGRWYSHPIRGGCHANEELGTRRPDGSYCAWKQSPISRTMRGWQLYQAGLNVTGLTCSLSDIGSAPTKCAPLATQVIQNKAVMERVLQNAALAPWSCG